MVQATNSHRMTTRRSKSLTQSGRQYNTKIAEHEKLAELTEKMVQDREKRGEEEIAQERTRREEEARAAGA